MSGSRAALDRSELTLFGGDSVGPRIGCVVAQSWYLCVVSCRVLALDVCVPWSRCDDHS